MKIIFPFLLFIFCQYIGILSSKYCFEIKIHNILTISIVTALQNTVNCIKLQSIILSVCEHPGERNYDLSSDDSDIFSDGTNIVGKSQPSPNKKRNKWIFDFDPIHHLKLKLCSQFPLVTFGIRNVTFLQTTSSSWLRHILQRRQFIIK